MARGDAPPTRFGYKFLAAGITIVLAILGGYRYAWRWEDAYWYALMAAGKTAHAIAPFTSRPLTPLIVRWIALLTGLTANHAFFLFGVVCVAVLAGFLFWLLSARNVDRPMLWLVALTSFWPLTFENYILPDLLNAALLCIFISLLYKKRPFAAALMLVPLALSRESVLVVLACFLAAGWRRLRWDGMIAAVGSTLAGIELVKFLARHSASNRHHLGFLAYMAGKVPWNFSANVLGLTLWSNDLQTFCSAPRWSHSLPIHFGRITAIGYCGYNPLLQLKFACSVLCLFGVLPLIFVLLWVRRRFDFWPADISMRFCFLYGAVCILLAPLLGSATDRLVSYSWPLFLLATPIQASETLALSRWRAVLLVVLSCILSWTGFELEQWAFAWVIAVFLAVVVVPVYIYAWKTVSSPRSVPTQAHYPALE